MKRGNGSSRVRAIVLAGVILSVFHPATETALAAETISNVKISFTAEETDSGGMPVVEGDTDSEKYSSGHLMTLEEYEENLDDDDDDVEPDSAMLLYNEINRNKKDLSELVYVMELEASEGYRFSSDKGKIRLSGIGAQLVKSVRTDKGALLVIFVKFSDLDDLAGEVETASWSSGGRGDWSQAPGAMKYELRLSFQGKTTGGIKVTAGTSYDFSPLLKRAGSYRFRVRPVSAVNDLGEWKESGEFQVSEEMAGKKRPRTGDDGKKTGPHEGAAHAGAGWRQTEDGAWWYQEQGGSYLQMNWLNENGFWYFFDEAGYMKRESYVKWGNDTYYVDKEGRMLSGAKAPDGRLAGSDGVLNWPEF